MTGTLLIRARLKRNPSIAAIARVLVQPNPSRQAEADHRLVWSLFAGDADQKRDFLWRRDDRGAFFILARRHPIESAIFDVEAKEFAPCLATGDRLQFSLRANATRAVKPPGSQARGKRADVVMAALHAQADRAAMRQQVIAEAGSAWLATQGEKHGFALLRPPRVDGYETLRIPRVHGRGIEISTLDFDGVLQVTDPAAFHAALLLGFGHAKAFGCGLMLIRRAG